MDVLYFAWVRERIGLERERVTPPPGIDTPAALAGWLAGRTAGHAAALADTARLRFAVDQRIVDAHAGLGDAREVAIFPPVTGG